MSLRLGAVLSLLLGMAPVMPPEHRAVVWSDLVPPIQHMLQTRGVGAEAFDTYVAGVRTRTAERLREGDLEHLVYYALQSTRITSRPTIEPALSAKAFVDGLSERERAQFLTGDWLPDLSRVPSDARARLQSLRSSKTSSKTASRTADTNIRLTHFRDVLRTASQAEHQDEQITLLRAYMRAMRFLYQKEFVAIREAGAVAALYQTRGLSSDTAVEASFGVYAALATAHGIDPMWRARRVLVIGPGLDLAPRTDLIDLFEPQSYQPFLVADALAALGIADRDLLRIDSVDINPLVVEVLQRAAHSQPLRLFILTGIAEDQRTHFADDYRSYFTALGHAVGSEEPWSTDTTITTPRLHKTLRVAPDVATAVSASVLNIVTDRVIVPTDAPALYDAIVITNVFPYLDDKELLLAVSNIATQLAPHGFLIHNEPRPLLGEAATAIGLPATQARTLLIATKTNGKHLYDAIWLHRKQQPSTSPPAPAPAPAQNLQR
jgi:hypothetical protein